MKSYRIGNGTGRRWPKLVLFFGTAVVLLVVAAVFGLKNLYERNLQAVDPNSQEDIIFVVESGVAAPQIADSLHEKGLIRSTRAFNQYVRSQELGESFIAGTYRLRKSYNVQTIVDTLTQGKVAVDLFTILPGKRLDQIKAAFVKEGYSEAEVDAALNPALYAGHPALVDKPAGASLEGYLYPDSYQMLAGETTPEVIIGQSLDEMAEALTPDIRAGLSAQGLSVYDGIILSSIVEREVSSTNPEDRARVAQVFLKRLRENIALQSDATAVYGAMIDGKLNELTNFSDILSYSSSYNTYEVQGLPPSPISNVTKNSLQAVVSPSDTNYLFFVAGKDCVTRFSTTLQEHEAYIESHGVADETTRCS